MSIETDPNDYHLWPITLPRPSYEQICDAVFYCIGSGALDLGIHRRPGMKTAAERKPQHVLARTLVASICMRVCGMSGPEVANVIGVSSHSTFVGASNSWAQYLIHSPGGIAMYNRVLESLVKQQRAKFGGAA